MAAAADVKNLLLQVDANVELLRRAMAEGGSSIERLDRDAQRTLDRFDRRLERTGAGGMPALQRGISGVRGALTGLVASLGVLSVGAAGSEFLSLADQSKQLRAQLQLATAEFGTFAQGQADVERIAATTRIGLEATTKLYGNLIRASVPLGKSQGDAARATETFAKALKVGGAGAEESASATLQFSQALASGVLRGDEFNSIAEASPRILKLLADAMGVPAESLRALAAQGELTSDKLYDALTNTKVTGGLDAEFRQLPVTFDESMTLVHDAAITAFGAFDRGGDFSNAIVSFVGDGADGFASLASKAEQFGVETRAVFDGLGNLFDPMEANGNAVFDALGIRIFSVREQITSLLDSIDQVANVYISADNFGTRIENGLIRGLNRAQTRAGAKPEDLTRETPLMEQLNLGGRFRSGARLSEARARRESAVRRLQGQGYIVPRNPDGTVNEAGIRMRETPKPRTPAPKVDPNVAKYQSQIADLEKLKAGASGKELATLNAQIARRQRIVSALQQGVGIEAARTAAGAAAGAGRSAASEAKKKEREEARAADEALRNDRRYTALIAREQEEELRARASISTDADERQRIQKQLRDTDVAAHLDAIATDKQLSDERKAELSAAVRRVAALEDERADQEARSDAVRRDLELARSSMGNNLDLLNLQAGLATTARDRRDVELRILAAQEELERRIQRAILDDPTSTAQQRTIAQAALKAVDDQHAGRVEAINRRTATPLEDYRARIQAAAGDMKAALEGVEVDGLEAIQDGLVGIITGTESVADAFGRMAQTIIADQARIAIRSEH